MNRNRFFNLIPWIIVLLAVISISSILNTPTVKRLNYNEFNSLVERGVITEINVSVANVVVDVRGTYKEGNQTIAFTSRIPNTEQSTNNLVERLQTSGAIVTIINPYESNAFVDALIQIVP
ncbi:MAG: ATP-dependent metallopeptidase FtsH/Yme1/Tma family protein, partial [Erysipelothrix sp.]|nr:ATP-dependent metallopeptidase FtsH/Yme1/Tma family protein [Erysipelothrix sp.]